MTQNYPVREQDLEKIMTGAYVTEASAIGLPPGKWPWFLTLGSDKFELLHLEHERGSDEIVSAVYVHEDDATIRVYND